MKLSNIHVKMIDLFEGVKVSSKRLDRALQNSDMNMGFEVEFLLDSASGESLSFAEIGYDNLDNYFYSTSVTESWQMEALSEYLMENEEEFFDREELEEDWFDYEMGSDWYRDWLDENDYDDENEDVPDEDEAKAQIKEERRDDIIEYIHEYMDNHIGLDTIAEKWFEDDPNGFVDAMRWELEDEYEYDEWSGDIKLRGGNLGEVTSNLEDYVGENVYELSDYHGEEKDFDNWYVEPDDSLGDNGAEISSPVKSVGDSTEDLEQIFDFMREHDYTTDDQCGLHISLSFPKGTEKEDVDWVKLAVMMGETHMLEAFDRVGNSYTESQFDKVLTHIESGNLEKLKHLNEFVELRKEIISDLKEKKHSSFNISQFEESGRIEFRIMGGADYEYKFEDVKKNIGRYVLFLEIAKDPTRHKQEYLKKLGKLIADQKRDVLKSTEQRTVQSSPEAKQWVRAISSAFGGISRNTVHSIDLLLKNLKQYSQDKDKDTRNDMLRNFFYMMAYELVDKAKPLIVSSMKINESISFIAFLIEDKNTTSKLNRMKKVIRNMTKKLGITQDDFKTKYNNSPSRLVNKIDVHSDYVDMTAVIGILMFPETDEIMKQKKNKSLYQTPTPEEQPQQQQRSNYTPQQQRALDNQEQERQRVVQARQQQQQSRLGPDPDHDHD